ncbi:MAG: SRPBCC domain-containing protein [Chloroflexota bacterium]
MIQPPVVVQSSNDKVIVTAVLPQLSPTMAFAHFTRPDLLALWWPETAAIDPQPGGAYRLSWPAMNWHLFGKYLSFEPEDHLVFSWQWEHKPDLPVRTVDVKFAPQASGSGLTVVHSTYGDSAVEQADRQSHIDGWVYFLSQLQNLGQPT